MSETPSDTTPATTDSVPTADAAKAGADEAKKLPSFAELGVKPELLKALEEIGYVEPMEVQAVTFPLILAGKDLMVQSRTGSGKTAAFGLPFFNDQVHAEEKHVQAIVLLPTRELALQVAAELARIGARSGIDVVPVYGGAPMGRQIEQLRAGGQIVCGTPGRILDHLRRGTLKLDHVKAAVLDECDEMLSMGFQEDIEAILERTPEARQTLLFSATVPEGIQRLSRRFMRKPEFVKLSADFVGVHEIRHVYYLAQGGDRERELLRVVEFENPDNAIIFCNTREETGRIAEYLRKAGMDAEAISSDLSQSDRERVMTKMRAGNLRFLVATDVAARGIDIENLPYVINYTFPESPEVYIHRTGRTGRAGKHGTAVSLIGPTEVGSFYYLKLLYKIRPEERALPSETEIRSKREGERVLVLREALVDEPGAEWRSLAKRLMTATDAERLVAALLARSFAGQNGLPAAPRPAAVAAPAAVASPRPAAARPEGGSSPARRDDERGPQRDRPPRDRDRPRSFDRPRSGPERERPRREGRPPRQPSPDSLPRPADKEFWEAWSEEKAAQVATHTAAPAAGATDEAAAAWGGADADAAQRAPEPKRPDRPAPALAEARPDVPEGMARLYFNLGRKDGFGDAEIAAFLVEHAGLASPPAMDVMNTHTYINVPAEDADRICAALTGKESNGRTLSCERARPRGERRPRR